MNEDDTQMRHAVLPVRVRANPIHSFEPNTSLLKYFQMDENEIGSNNMQKVRLEATVQITACN